MRSNPIYDRLGVGETKRYDVNNDMVDNIAVTLKSITDGVAAFTFVQLIHEERASPAGPVWCSWWWIVLIVAGALVYIWTFLRRKTHE